MASLTYSITISGSGVTIRNTEARTSGALDDRTPTLPKGYAGTLTTRTDNNTGTATLVADHGITTGMKVDIYFEAGVQYNVTVGTVSGTSVPFDLGLGDNLPIATSAIVISPRISSDVQIVGDDLDVLAVQSAFTKKSQAARTRVEFQDDADAIIEATVLEGTRPKVYDTEAGDATFAGETIETIVASNESTLADAVLKVLPLWDSGG